MMLESDQKILKLDLLSQKLGLLRSQGKRVVHCHGVFDLLHVGHIRHFEEARKFGDVLVVTITPDRFVNKGPHRPSFPELLRAEAIAALSCVDFVAINEWPSAVETLGILRPDFYVKGQDYRDASKDVSGGIDRERKAVEAVGGQLVFTDDITFSSSSLINKYMSAFPGDVKEYLAGFAVRHGVDEVLGYLEKAKGLRVLVVGEAIIDEYCYCDAIGKSSKSPTLVVRSKSSEKFAGGIVAVANHVASFCDRVGMVTYLGADAPQEEFIRSRLSEKVKPFFFGKKASPTIVKRRFVDEYFFSKLLEVYEINDEDLDSEDEATLCAILDEHLPQYDLVIVVDYGHGMMSQKAVVTLCAKSRFLALNVQANAGNRGYRTISAYPRADYVCAAESEARLEARSRRGDPRDIARAISTQLSCPRVVVTQGSKGCVCYSEGEGLFEMPSVARDVVDRVGAGDAFMGVSALCAVQKAPMEIVGLVGNAAGAQAVATVCNRRAVDRVSLFKQVESLMK
jgi:rfaE bifunctional protein kinase chain/domain/rfaE bifunctional protein nucleotidyltransferase chain/domain